MQGTESDTHCDAGHGDARLHDPERLRISERLRRVRDRMDREYARPLSVASLAAAVGYSAGHLSREFHAVYGESPYSYLMTRRIERAMTLLRRDGTAAIRRLAWRA